MAPGQIYKPIDESTVFLTEDEKNKILEKARLEKIGKINNENYLAAVNSPYVFKIPSFHDLHSAVIHDLETFYNWKIDRFNEQQIIALCLYHAGDLEFEKLGEGFSLSKGNLMRGPIGCGKSTLFKLFARNPFNPYIFLSARNAADQFAENGHEVINFYSSAKKVIKKEFFGHENAGFGFDDIGTEEIKKNFGNEENVLEKIFLNRYDNSELKGKTHATTNLPNSALKHFYGARCTSRFKQIFNFIEFPFDAPDRR